MAHPFIEELLTPSTRRRVLWLTLGFSLAGVIFAVALPKWFTSVATVVPAKTRQGGGLSSLLGGEGVGLSSSLLGGAVGNAADIQRIAAVLKSVAATDAVIEKFDLLNRYGKRYREDARQDLWRHCEVKPQAKPNLVELRCEDKDPKFAQELVAFLVEYGNQLFRRVNVSSASEEVHFLENRVTEMRRQADDVAQRMREFQEKHKIIDLDTQAKAVVSSMAMLNSQRIGKQLELDYTRTYASADDATARQLESQLSVMRRKMRDLEQADPGSQPLPTASNQQAGRGVFPAALDVPRLRTEYETLYRDRRVAEAALIFALEHLESAKADEARDVSTFIVLDPPTLPTKKSRPGRISVVLLFATLGLGISIGFEAWRLGYFQALVGMPGKTDGSAT